MHCVYSHALFEQYCMLLSKDPTGSPKVHPGPPTVIVVPSTRILRICAVAAGGSANRGANWATIILSSRMIAFLASTRSVCTSTASQALPQHRTPRREHASDTRGYVGGAYLEWQSLQPALGDGCSVYCARAGQGDAA